MFYHVALSGLKIIRSSALVVQISLEMNFSRTIIVHSFPVSATHLLLFSTSVTRLGDFRKLFESRLLYKISQNVWWLFASSKTSTFEVKTAVATFGQLFGKLWATFNFNIWSHWSPNLAFLLIKLLSTPQVIFRQERTCTNVDDQTLQIEQRRSG